MKINHANKIYRKILLHTFGDFVILSYDKVTSCYVSFISEILIGQIKTIFEVSPVCKTHMVGIFKYNK